MDQFQKYNLLKALKDILQYFKIVNWRIRGFVFLCHEQKFPLGLHFRQCE